MSDRVFGGQVARRETSEMEQIVRAANNDNTNPNTDNSGGDSGGSSDSGSSGGSSSSSTTAGPFGGMVQTKTSSTSTATGTSSSSGDGIGESEWLKISFEEPSSTVLLLSAQTLAVNYDNSDRDITYKSFHWYGNSDSDYKVIYNGNPTEKEFNSAVFTNVTDSGVVLNLSYLNQGSRTSYLGKSMRLTVGWTSGDVSGNSSSSYFAVVRDTSSEASASAAVSSADDGIKNGVQETITTGAVSSTSGASSSSSGKSHGGGGGLSGGAIAGIVIGVVGGLLLIAAAAFFLLRKRRKNKNVGENYAATDSANAYMVDKETQGRATDTPNSPYSDENQARSLPIDENHHDEPAHTTAPVGGVPRTSTGGSYNSRAETPQGVSSNVAHLVEEGMTLDEIRRLEEEERQLDDEIERAARR